MIGRKKKLYCNKCKELIGVVTIPYHYNPSAGNYIVVSACYNNWDINQPPAPEGYVYDRNLYYHVRCWEGEAPDIFSKLVKLEE